MTNLVFLSACDLAAMIRDRTVSAVELLNAYLAQIEKHNPKLHAICTLDADNAKTRAIEADTALAQGEYWGPLHGIPITFKDIFETAGLKTTAGYIPLQDYLPQHDATAVARLRTAGAIILGKTNLAELGGDFQSTNSLFPRVNNPWHLDYTPGGSSGGSAAAVVAGLSALDLGNDFGGSVRQPAHFCGVYALKPTDRRISTAGVIPEVPGLPICLRQMMTVGILARSLQDIRLCFSLVAGADPRRPEVPPIIFDASPEKAALMLKLAWTEAWAEVPIGSETQGILQNVYQKLIEAGVQMRSAPPFSYSEIFDLYGRMAAYVSKYAQPVNGHTIRPSVNLLWRTATQGDQDLRHLGNFSRFLPELLRPTLKGYFETLTERDRFTAQIDAALEPFDAWLCPVAATPAFTHRPAWTAVDIDGRAYPHAVANGAYVIPFNASGHPAVVIPVGQTQQGLPVGLQIVGKRWREQELLAIAAHIDSIVGNFQTPAGY
jgi:amidase